jgi:hypothetical protein
VNVALGLGALLAFGHPPSIVPAGAPVPGLAPVAEPFPTLAAAVSAFVGDAGGVLAFGELHQTTQTRAGAGSSSARSTLARFTDEILPAIAPHTSHLIVETWVSRGDCGETEKHVTADVARTTQRPAETESEIVRLLRRAKELGIAPHVLEVGCAEYGTLVGAGGQVDYDRLLTLTGQHLGRAVQQALALRRAADRPLVVVYGGALHNDLNPDPALAAYSFGPEIDALTGGAYRELDLYLPELVRRLPPLRQEPWYPVWRRAAPARGALLIRRGPRSAVLLPAAAR